MKKYVFTLTSIAVFLAFGVPIANAENVLPSASLSGNLGQPRPEPPRRMYCEMVGSGLYDCEEQICSDWTYSQCSCWIVVYRRDGEP